MTSAGTPGDDPNAGLPQGNREQPSRRRLTPDQRDSGVRRLRHLTVGVAIGGLAAVGGVGYVAAATFPGTSTSSGTSAAAGSAGATAPTGSGLQAPAQAPTGGGRGGGTVTSGGS
jgi:hypothetical protein